MAKLSAEQQRQLDDLQALAAAPDDGDDAVWVENGDGHRTRLTGTRATAWLKRNGYDAEDAEDATQTDPLVAKKTASPAKKAVKKAAPPAGAATDDTGADGGEALDPDAPPPSARRREFF